MPRWSSSGTERGGADAHYRAADRPPAAGGLRPGRVPHAVRYRFAPELIDALVAAESNFEAGARHGEARGLFQLKPEAWRTVSADPYEPGVWDWRTNLRVGVEYLAWCRHTLHRHDKFSYPALLACFHHGLEHMRQRDFAPGRVAVPDNRIYRELWAGNLQPVPPPRPVVSARPGR